MSSDAISFERSSGDKYSFPGCSIDCNFNNIMPPDNELSNSLRERIHVQKGKPVLDLSLCTISRVPLDEMISIYGEIESLDLSFNTIRFLPPQFALKLAFSLVKLDLSRNELRRLPDNFGSLEQLVYLDLHKNQLQTLPLSMGKMRQLQYLNILENPFRSPLCNFLDTEHMRVNRELGGVDAASLIIKFLAKVSHETFACGDAFSSASRPTTRRVVTFETDDEENLRGNLDQEPPSYRRRRTDRNQPQSRADVDRRLSEDSGFGNTLLAPSRCPAEISLSCMDDNKGMPVVEMRIYGTLMVILGLFLFPILMALFFETSFLDSVVVSHRRWSHAWKAYKPYHQIAEQVLTSLQLRYRVFYMYGPSASDEEANGNFLQLGYRKIVNAFGYMLSYVWGDSMALKTI